MTFRRGARRMLLVCIVSLPGIAAVRAGQDFQGFHAEFRRAVARNDAARVADLTRLPFLFEGRQRDRAGFLHIYGRLFSPDVRPCLATARAQEEGGDRVVFCRPYAFYFDRQGGAWKLREFNADGEDMP